MKRLLVAALACLVAAELPGVHAVPARLPYEPSAQKQAELVDLRGSRWCGSDIESGDWEITFEKDGTITYTYKGRTFRNGTWEWQGDALYFETNKKFYEFRGTLRGNRIDGESWNVNGSRWPTSIQRASGLK